mgnify:CR=1 FL=1
MKTLRVAAAAIFRTAEEGEKQVFATQRGYGDWKDWWEFPGGKIEAGETPVAALAREIREELAVEIKIERRITTVDYDYPAFHLSMDCYACSLAAGKPELLEHENAAWLSYRTLRSVRWLPADEAILPLLEKLLLEFTDGHRTS